MSNSIRSYFSFKLNAAKYHLLQIHITYGKHKDLFDSQHDSILIQPIHYHYQAFVYQLASAFEMVMQLINDQEGLGCNIGHIAWNPNDLNGFYCKLQEKNESLFKLINGVFSEEWLKALRETRNHLFHRGNITLMMEINEEEVAIINPVVAGKIFYFDANHWGEKISELFNKVYSEEVEF